MKYHTLVFSKIREDVAKFVVCCSHDWRFKGQILSMTEILSVTSLLINKVPAILSKQRISKYYTTNSGCMFEYNKVHTLFMTENLSVASILNRCVKKDG